MKPPKFPTIEKYLRDVDNPISSNDFSHEGYIVPEIVNKYGDMKRKSFDLLKLAYRLLGSLYQMKISAKSIIKNPYLNNLKISVKDLNELEKYAKSLGVSSIGYTKVNPSYIFKGKKILFNNAIVLTMEMKRDRIDKAPSFSTNKEIFRTYHELGKIVNKIAKFLTKRGFNAQAGPAIGGDVNYVLLARDAGLGEIGNHGLLITEEFGPSLRLAAVYTDIENLPISNNNKHKWIKEFCDKCNICVKKCPANAIYHSPMVLSDGSEQHIDYKKCAIPFSRNYGCTLCVKNCTFYKLGYNKIKEKFNGNI